jgi:hypothetical protein
MLNNILDAQQLITEYNKMYTELMNKVRECINRVLNASNQKDLLKELDEFDFSLFEYAPKIVADANPGYLKILFNTEKMFNKLYIRRANNPKVLQLAISRYSEIYHQCVQQSEKLNKDTVRGTLFASLMTNSLAITKFKDILDPELYKSLENIERHKKAKKKAENAELKEGAGV